MIPNSSTITTRKHVKTVQFVTSYYFQRQCVLPQKLSLTGCHMNVGVVWGRNRRCAALCDRDLDPNQNGDLSANHRAPQRILSCGLRRGLQKHKTMRRSPLSLAISTEVKAFIWTGSLFSSSWRLTAF